MNCSNYPSSHNQIVCNHCGALLTRELTALNRHNFLTSVPYRYYINPYVDYLEEEYSSNVFLHFN